MGEDKGQRIRVILRMIQILDNLEPAWEDEGEFRFHVKVSSRNKGGWTEEFTLPRKKKFYRISDNPAWNRRRLDEVLFEGEVEDHFELEIRGEEIDLLSANDELDTYHRVWEGPPQDWIGHYRPGDEGSDDPERMSNWWAYIEIEEA
jgi:hypothetical protein